LKIPVVLGSALGVLATAGQTILYLSEDEDTFGLGMFVILGMNAFIGLAASLRADPFTAPADPDPRAAKAASAAMFGAFRIVLLAIAIQVVLGIVQAGVFAAVSDRIEWTAIFEPFLFAGLVGICGGLAGLLVGILLVWPIIKLIGVVLRLVTRRPLVAGVAPLSVLLIATVAAAVFTVLAPHAESAGGGTRGRGLALLIGVWFDYSGDLGDQVFAWIARGLQLVIAGLLVWLATEVRAARKARATGS
jgi:hypothetical protein